MILGKLDLKTNGLIDPNNASVGFWVMYGGGDICKNGDVKSQNGKPRRSKFKFYCDGTQEENVK